MKKRLHRADSMFFSFARGARWRTQLPGCSTHTSEINALGEMSYRSEDMEVQRGEDLCSVVSSTSGCQVF